MTIEELKEQFAVNGLDFDKEYKRAEYSVHPAVTPERRDEIIRTILEAVLIQYTNSIPKTKVGKVLRTIASIFKSLIGK